MSFFKKKKRSAIKHISFPMLARNTLYDCGITEPEPILQKLGFSRVSDEVSEMERRASDERLDKIAFLEPVVFLQAQVVANALASMYLSDKDEGTESLIHDLVESYVRVAASAGMAAISVCSDMDLIEIKGV